MDYQFLTLHLSDEQVATITLNRPEIHNAFNDALIEELIAAFNHCDRDENTRLVVLTGAGKSFCAGADLNWMSSMVNYSKEENFNDSMSLSNLFKTIDKLKKPVIGKINGHALGGGVGLVSVCDYVLAKDNARFGFTEVRLGLIPAVISPYCIRKIGETHARAWFLSGEQFDCSKAQQMGLVHEYCSEDQFENRFQELLKSFLKAAPEATIKAKELVRQVLRLDEGDVQQYTCNAISEKRVSAEGQEGMKALLEKRKPNWMKI